jgi:hypothetical protein
MKLLKCPACETFLPLKQRNLPTVTCRVCGLKVRQNSASAEEADVCFSLLFENDFTTDQRTAGRARRVELVPGKEGMGALFAGTAALTYPTTNCLNPKAGNIVFWVQPRWPGNDGRDHVFFDVGDGYTARMRIQKDGANNLRFIVWGAEGEAGIGYSISDWQPDEWHQVAVNWQADKLELYIDGSLRASTFGVTLPGRLPLRFYIGSSTVGDKQADAVIDEFIIYDRPAGPGIKKIQPTVKTVSQPSTSPPVLQYTIPTLVICYFPVREGRVDRSVTGDVGGLLDDVRRHVIRTTDRVVAALEKGSTYHGYKNSGASPSLNYKIVDTIEFLEPLPTFNKPGHRVPMTDYNAILQRVDIRRWVETKGVKEVWLWGYHGGKVDLWESNMAGPFGDISNSDRDPHDMPVLGQTYTLYHYNYQRGASEAVEDHMHQIEAVLNYVDGRDRTPPERWPALLFWGRFVGSDKSHKIVRPGCGWAHYPPNGERDYDWANRRYVWTDIEDWRPDGSGKKQKLNCERWHCDSLTWFIYWMQNLPGADNDLMYQGRPLRNWWDFIGDFDMAMRNKWKLTA